MVTPGCKKHRCWGTIPQMYCKSPKPCQRGTEPLTLPDAYKKAPLDVLNLQLLDVSEQFGTFPNTSDTAQRHIEQADNPSWSMNRHHWSYRAMCNFWVRGILEVPEVRSLEYYMRMDTDSRLQCRHATYDPFRHMAQDPGLSYGLFSFIEDSPEVTQELNKFVSKYVKEHSELHPPEEQLKKYWTNPKSVSKPPSFYNNLEIVKIPFMLQPAVAAFNQAIEDSRGIWSYRWGDACIRYAQMMLFGDPVKSMLCLDLFTDIKYAHASAGYELKSWCVSYSQTIVYDQPKKLEDFCFSGK